MGSTNNVSGKVVLVTGASSGIGEAASRLLASAGASVALAARRKDKLNAIVKDIKAGGGIAEAFEVDVTDEDACVQLIEDVETTFSPIDVLVNNAGVMLLGPVKDAPTDEWRTMIRVNIFGVLYMTHAILPRFYERKQGHIINISSVAGRTASAGSAVYNATKWGVNAFTEALRHELTQDKTTIRTTLIEPGAVVTELLSHNRDAVQGTIEKRIGAINKRLEADDIARAIHYAISQPPHVNVNEVLIRPTEQDG